ncbi:hypothetical protein GF325_04055 [Candidatus Bathyarchaeota archaeon]|nr:hypothetical protein [Candidatus Bathyarchaeota archaeon]
MAGPTRLKLNRANFLAGLLDKYKDRGGIHLQGDVKDISIENGIQTCHLASGDELKSSMLIGADGVNSHVREACGFEKVIKIPVIQYLVEGDLGDPRTIYLWNDQRYKGHYRYLFPSGNR